VKNPGLKCKHLVLQPNICHICRDYLALWNEKLTLTGHKEIEDFRLPNPPLKRNEAAKFRNIDPDVFLAKQSYFQQAQRLTDTYAFKNSTHKRIWELHSRGYTLREISAYFKKRNSLKSKDKIHKIIRDIAYLGGIKFA
jgi:hypothetical protein